MELVFFQTSCYVGFWCPGHIICMADHKRNHKFKIHNPLFNVFWFESIIWNMLSASNKIFSFKIAILHCAIQGGCTTVWTDIHTHMHACMHLHCFEIQSSDLTIKKSNSKCIWFYSNTGYCCAEWNNMVYFTRGANDGDLARFRDLLKYIIWMSICHTHTHMYCTSTEILYYFTYFLPSIIE